MSDDFFAYEAFKNIVDVPRETFLRLEEYLGILRKWQGKINLISHSTLGEVWTRHVIDSIQLLRYLDKKDRIMDIGSGAGFPGMVLAIAGMKNVMLIESDSRKVAFLKEVARITNTKVNIVNTRVEEMTLENTDVVTARGFASLKDVFSIFGGKIKESHNMLLLKGRNINVEIEEAEKEWNFSYKQFPSITGNDGAVILIQHLTRKGG